MSLGEHLTISCRFFSILVLYFMCPLRPLTSHCSVALSSFSISNSCLSCSVLHDRRFRLRFILILFLFDMTNTTKLINIMQELRKAAKNK